MTEFPNFFENFLDRAISTLILASNIEINRGDLRRLAPRKKLLKSCADSLESLRAFSVSYLAHRSLSIAAQNERKSCDDHYARTNREN
jgi:hypothetical protein